MMKKISKEIPNEEHYIYNIKQIISLLEDNIDE